MVAKVLYAKIKALPGHEAFLKDAITNYALTVRKEAGNVRFEVYELQDGSLHIEETYKDDAAFQHHISTDYGKKFNEAIKGKVVGGGSECVFLKSVCTTLP